VREREAEGALNRVNHHETNFPQSLQRSWGKAVPVVEGFEFIFLGATYQPGTLSRF
jgi:hypothetical protein